jgi:hypothetical protein
MPRFLSGIFTRTQNPHTTTTEPLHRYEGFTPDGRIVLSDRRGTRKAEIPDVSTKSETLSDDPLAIYNRKFFITGAQVGLYIQTDTNVDGSLPCRLDIKAGRSAHRPPPEAPGGRPHP